MRASHSVDDPDEPAELIVNDILAVKEDSQSNADVRCSNEKKTLRGGLNTVCDKVEKWY